MRAIRLVLEVDIVVKGNDAMSKADEVKDLDEVQKLHEETHSEIDMRVVEVQDHGKA